MPPKPIRRPVTVTTWLIVSTVCVLASPLLFAVAAILSALTRRRKPWVLARLFVAYFLHELIALIALGVLWVVAGLGRRIGSSKSQRRHWRLAAWFFGWLAETGRRALEIDVQADPTPEAVRALESDDPLIVFSRHAGPGDTIFIIDELLSRFHRRPERRLQGDDRDRSERRPDRLSPSPGHAGHLRPGGVRGADQEAHRRARAARLRSCCFPRAATSPPSAGARPCDGSGARAAASRPGAPKACRT